MRPFVLACALLLIVPGTAAYARSDGGERLEPEKLLFLLQYIGVDYGDAVRGGEIVNAFEYQEMTLFSELLLQQADVLEENGAPPELRAELGRLRGMIRELAPWSAVRGLVGELTSTFFDSMQSIPAPVATPDLARGEELYAGSCAPCHGPTGGGDGFGDPEMDPPATSFHGARMNLLSPHQIYSGMLFGVDGTAMPSYLGALEPQEMWDVAFHLLTLREDFEPGDGLPAARPTLELLARSSNDDMLRWLSEQGFPARVSDVDYYRQKPPLFQLPRLADAEAPAPAPQAVPTGDPLQLAVGLQDAFAGVAEAVFPSVVNVTSFVRGRPEDSPGDPSWQVASAEARMYPGFKRLRSGSGFCVTEDGYLLTGYHVVVRDDGEPAEVLDVELPNGRHILARLVGAEPTINLAVLKLQVVSELRPPKLTPVTIGDSDAIRVGHWAIAVGDPWGPEQTYAVGTLAAPASRQCYQEDLTGTLLQATVSVHREAYGGPLVDIHGRVVGMTVPPPGAVELVPRASEFGLPINLAMNIYEALKLAESRRSPWLGFSVLELAAVHRRGGTDAPADLPRTGVYIDDLFEPSPAARAGVRVGDSLVAIDGNRLFSVLDFQKWLYLSGIGRTIELEIYRDGKTLRKKVTVEERPANATTS
jgi:S1-C subfamily serine protease/mono/diheme cytochrome c family protein